MGKSDLIKLTPADKLLERIAADKAKRQQLIEKRNQEKLSELRKYELLKALISVYRFLIYMGMEPGEVTLEEFEAAEEKLKELAKEKVQNWVFRIRHPKQRGFYKYYLENGFFSSSKITPFYDVYPNYLNRMLDCCETKKSFGDVIEILMQSFNLSNYLPTNCKDLYNTLWAKRFPEYQS